MDRRAFTLVETLLAIGIVTITTSTTVPLLRDYQVRQDLDLAAQQTVQALRRAQTLSQTGNQDGQWGLQVEQGTVYLGSQYTLRQEEFDEMHAISDGITVSGITDVAYSRIEGRPSVTGEIVLEAINGDQVVITITDDGIALLSGESEGEDEGGEDGGDVGESEGDGGAEGSAEGAAGGDDGGSDGDSGGGGGGGDSSGQIARCDTYAAAPGGYEVTTGDLDGDLYPDIGLTSFTDGSVSIFLSNADGTLRTPLSYDVARSARAIAFADIDGDTDADVLVGNFQKDTIRSLLNQGDGMLDQMSIEADKYNIPYEIEVADVNLDGSTDLIVSHHKDVSILLNDGSGGLDGEVNDVENIRGFSGTNEIEVVDLNQDGYPDIAIAYAHKRGGSHVAIALGSGDGTYVVTQSIRTDSTNPHALDLIAGDIDADGDIDLLLGENGSSVSVLSNDGVGTFSLSETVNTIGTPRHVALVDTNDDGYLDLIYGNQERSKLYVHLGHATDGFAVEYTSIDLPYNPYDLRSDDIDQDGDQDLVASHGDDASYITVLINGANGFSCSEEGDANDADDANDEEEDEAEDDAPCQDVFEVAEDGTVNTLGSTDVTFRALGAEITYGAGGPEIDVTVQRSLDQGASWTALFGGRDIDGGETEILPNLTAGVPISLRLRARYRWWYDKTVTSNDGSGYVKILRNGDTPPDIPAFADQRNLSYFLREILDDQGRIDIGENDAVFLTELGSLNSPSTDYQDAVILMTLKQRNNTCTSGNHPRFKVVFDRVENSGTGNAEAKAFVGPGKVAYAESQWIPLKIGAETVIDSGLVESVPGISLQRKSGVLRVFLQGSLPSGGNKEIVDARLVFENASVQSTSNVSGQDKSENPFDGIVNDGPGGDEVTVSSDQQTVLFQTRVTTADDAIDIAWDGDAQEGDAEDATDAEDVEEAEDANDAEEEFLEDPELVGVIEPTELCTVRYRIEPDASITLLEPADISVRALGSHARYGVRGPEIEVRAGISFDGGGAWQSLFKYRDIDGGEKQSFSSVSEGSNISLRVEGRHGWMYKKKVDLHEQSGRAKIFRDGTPVPTVSAFQDESLLRGFLRSKVRRGRIRIAAHEILGLFELDEVSEGSDYADAAIVLGLSKPGVRCDQEEVEDADEVEDVEEETVDEASNTEGSDEPNQTDEDTSPPLETTMEICYFPPGNPFSPRTIKIGSDAWERHKRQGARPAPCEEDSDGDTVVNSKDLCPGTAMPESSPDDLMHFGRYALTRKSFIYRKGPRLRVGEWNIRDTRGCSCEQIVRVAEGRKNYYFGNYYRLHQNLRNLFPFYTRDAWKHGCSSKMLKMVKRGWR